MTKTEIIGITIDELSDRFDKNPESFEYTDFATLSESKDETIIWKTRIISGDEMITDPSIQERTIIVSFYSESNMIKVSIYNSVIWTSIGNFSTPISNAKPDAVVESKKLFKRFGKNYRKFKKLKKKILAYQENQEAIKFFKKLSSTFPSAMDDHLLGKK